MTHERSGRAERSATDGAATARPLLRIGSWKVSVTVVAWGLSAIVHGGLFTAAYFVTWNPAPVSLPEIHFARGDRATPIQVRLVPVDAEPTEPDHGEVIPAEDSSAAIVPAEEVVAELPAEVVEPDRRVEPPVAAPNDPDLLVEKRPEEREPVVTPLAEEVRELDRADVIAEAVARAQPVGEMIDYLFDRFELLLDSLDRTEPVDHPPVRVAEAVEEPIAPSTKETVRTSASFPQTTGAVTGVATLNLPAPQYPSLSRRRGEEGLVLLQVEVLPDGRVGAIVVLREAGFVRLTEAAIAAARKGRFKPATRDGHPIRATVRIPFRFVLD